MSRSITFSGRQILADGKPTVLYGGEYQYFRAARSVWEPSLTRLKEAGCNLITCYVPWIWHEPEPGVYDFTGETRPERDFVGFIELVDKLDMALIVRPGPYVYAEYQGFGVPDWLREQHPELLMVHETGPGREFAVNHPEFLPHVETWFRHVWPLVEPWAKKGRVIAWQVDNEVGLPQFGTAPGPGEFNPATLARYRQFLHDRFPDLAAVNEAMGTRWTSWEAISAPRKVSATVAEMWLWADFVEADLVDYLANLQQMIRDIGITLPLLSNDPCSGQWPNNFAKKARLMPIGYDLYSKVNDGPTTHDLPFSNSYVPALFRAANPDGPLAAVELACGWFNPAVKVKPEATLQLAMQVLTRGTNLLSYYILQDAIEPDGTPWTWGAALDTNGEPTPRYNAVRKVGHFLTDHAEALATSTELKSPIAIGHYLSGNRIGIKPGISMMKLLDIDGSALLTHFSGPSSLFGVLSEAGYNPDVVMLEGASLEQLQRFRVIFLCSTGYMDDDTFRTLSDYVAGGGILITAGQPVRLNLLNRAYEDNVLFPAKPLGSLNHTHFGNRSFATQTAVDLLEYQWSRRSMKHRLSLATLDQLHPLVDLIKHIGKMGTWVQTDRGHPLWASRFTSAWHGHGVTPLLKLNGTPIGYSARHGAGKSIFLGTLPGIFYDSPLYYSKDTQKKASIREFFTTLLREAGVRPLHGGVPGLEVVVREGDGYHLVIVNNKGPAQQADLDCFVPLGPDVETLFTGWGSRLTPGTTNKVQMAADDVLVLRYR